MVHDRYGRQIEVDDEVIVRGRVVGVNQGFLQLASFKPLPGGAVYTFTMSPDRVEKVVSDPGPFLTNDMPVKGDKCAG